MLCRRSVNPTSPVLPLLLVAAIAATAGCSRPSTSPIESSGARSDLALDAALPGELDAIPFAFGGVVDLNEGRLTEVEHRFGITFFPTGSESGTGIGFVQTIRSTIEGTREVDGTLYVVERERVDGDPGFESLFRQDRSGLYLWQEDISWPVRAELAGVRASRIEDAAQSVIALAAEGDAGRAAALEAAWAALRARRQAVAAALGQDGSGDLPILRGGPAGGPGASEITFLRYPLRPGASWDGRIGFNIWTVEALETVLTPVGRFRAGRLNIHLPDFFGPGDRYVTWWGAPGELQRAFTSVMVATDGAGNEIGSFVAVESRRLTAYEPGSLNP